MEKQPMNDVTRHPSLREGLGGPHAVHINEALQILDLARERKQTVNLRVWEMKTGADIEYRGWLVSSSNWRGGWHRVINPANNQVRTVPDILIHEINGLAIYL